jgi:hypothetical protein
VDAGEFDQVADSLPLVRRRVYEAVSAVVSDDHNYERGVQTAQAITHNVLAESGPAGLAEMVVELASKLAEAAGRIAAEHGVAAYLRQAGPLPRPPLTVELDSEVADPGQLVVFRRRLRRWTEMHRIGGDDAQAILIAVGEAATKGSPRNNHSV